MRWIKASKRDLPALTRFLTAQEWRAVPFTSRLRRQGEAVFPSRLEALILICRGPFRSGEGIRGAMMLTSGGLLLPVFAGATSLLPTASALRAKLRSAFLQVEPDEVRSELYRFPAVPAGPFPGFNDLRRRLYSVMGPLAEVSWLEKILPLRAGASIDYYLMILDRNTFFEPGRLRPPFPTDLAIRSACPQDLPGLLPLQIRYELEEVVVSKERFSEPACRQNLKRALREQLVLMAELNGSVVAKAGTNARGFGVDQIGGVFTLEKLRNSGIAFRVMEELLRRVFAHKDMACLFVKKDNLPALALYKRLGFATADSYRISYFQI
jgi:GNAT superfamily N-acetyltransferase